MILAKLKRWISGHFVFECIFILTIIAEKDILINIKHSVFDILFSESSKQLTIQIISNSTSIQHLAYHVFKHLSVNLLNLILLRRWARKVIQIFLDKAKGGLEIGVIVFIRYTPTQWTKFTSFNYNGMQIADCKDKILPVSIIDFFKELLVDHSGECLVKTSFQTFGRFVCYFDDFLQQTKRESIVRLTSYP